MTRKFKKRTCTGCKALDLLLDSRYPSCFCRLGYANTTESGDIRPLEFCQKPRTIQEYIKLSREKEDKN